MDWMKGYRLWMEKASEEPEVFDELQSVKADPVAIQDRFYRDMEFGTGGLRGVLGAGRNRMNVYTVAKATQGYSSYLNRTVDRPAVVIAYDSRIHSEDFARTAAAVFAGNGVKVYMYPKLMPTPSLSFAVQDLNCSGWVVITASHNPAQYNGYKVYGADGCPITVQAARDIQTEIDQVGPFQNVKRADFDTALAQGMISWIGEDTVQRYLAAVGTASVLPENMLRDVSIACTLLNGAGISCVPRCLEEHGLSNITIPAEQECLDGNFPTCPYPNPEVREALEVGLRWAEKTDSELLLATDPDTGWARQSGMVRGIPSSAAMRWACSCWIFCAECAERTGQCQESRWR